jgi:hypothetical protein
MSKLKYLIGTLCILITLASASYVLAQDPETNQDARDTAVDYLDILETRVTGEEPRDDKDRVSIALAGIMQAVLSLVGLALIVLLVYAGLLWMTARGNDEQVERARKYIANAIIGLIIVLMAYTVTIFVVQQLSSAVFESRFGF